MGAMLDAGVIENAAIAQSTSDATAFWRVRDATAEFPMLLPDRSRSTSASRSPTSASPRSATRRCAWPASTVLAYGHLGDGNLHLIVQVPDEQGIGRPRWPMPSRPWSTASCASIAAQCRPNTASAPERGVLGHTRSPAELAAMRAIKAALDPRGILNPGKLLPATPPLAQH